MMSIVLRVDRLALRGVNPLNASVLAAALLSELRARLKMDGSAPRPTDHACLSDAIGPLALNAVMWGISRQVAGVLGAEK